VNVSAELSADGTYLVEISLPSRSLSEPSLIATCLSFFDCFLRPVQRFAKTDHLTGWRIHSVWMLDIDRNFSGNSECRNARWKSSRFRSKSWCSDRFRINITEGMSATGANVSS